MESISMVAVFLAVAALVVALCALRTECSEERLDRCFDEVIAADSRCAEISEELAVTGSALADRLAGIEARMNQRCEVERVLTGMIHELGQGSNDELLAEHFQKLTRMQALLASIEASVRESLDDLTRRVGSLEDRVIVRKFGQKRDFLTYGSHGKDSGA